MLIDTKNNVDALILCAGRGERLLPFTRLLPKPLMPIQGRPILEYWLCLLKSSGVTRIFINVHHLADEISKMISSIVNDDLEIILLHEDIMLGTGGTIGHYRDLFKNDLLIIHGDNYGLFDLRPFISFHKHLKQKDSSKFSLMTFTTDTPQTCGIFEQDHLGKILTFDEKPSETRSNVANAAVYLLNAEQLEIIKKNNVEDLSVDFLSKYYLDANLWHFDDQYMDVGNIEYLRKANFLILNLPQNLVSNEWLKGYQELCLNIFNNEELILKHLKN